MNRSVPRHSFSPPAPALLSLAALSLTALLLPVGAVRAQTQPISAAAILPTLTYAFNHTSVVTLGTVAYDFNYYDFNITGFTHVGANNPDYDLFSFSNGTLEKQPGVVAVASAYLPDGWTFDDSHDFVISTDPLRAIHADDPQFGLIFIQTRGTAPIAPTGPFALFHQVGGAVPFTRDGVPVTIYALPEASTTVSLGLLLALGLGGVVVAKRKRLV